MSDNKENEIIVDIGNQSTNQDTGEIGNAESAEELKKQAGELLKAAGGLAGSLGKFAIKKGSQIKEKLEDEEFQEKINSNIKNVTDKIDDYVSSDSAKDRKVVNVKGVIDEQQDVNPQAAKKTPGKKLDTNEIETSFEVEGNETVNFETKKPPKGIVKAIEQGKAERKAEKERKRAEKERKRKEDQKQSLMAALLLLGIAVICMVMSNLNKDSHEGQIHAPLSSTDAYELNYEDVVKQFEAAGFTNIDTMKMEDLVVGLLSSDGGVDKITIDGEEEYSTTSWYDPSSKVLVYYHTYPPESSPEDNDVVKDEDEQPQEKTEAATQEDETSEDAEDEEENSSSESSKGISENQVMGIVLEYGQYNFDITFRIVLTEAAVESDGAGTGWDCCGSCKWKNASRNEVYGTFRAHVTKDGEVDSFNIY